MGKGYLPQATVANQKYFGYGLMEESMDLALGSSFLLGKIYYAKYCNR